MRPYVTGYWEEDVQKEVCNRRIPYHSPFLTSCDVQYCLGPVPNPVPFYRHLATDLIYVVTTERKSVLKYSLWPSFSANSPYDDERAESKSQVTESVDYPGQLQAFEARKAHFFIYALLVLSRALCFVIVQCATEILPIKPKPERIFSSDYELYAVSFKIFVDSRCSIVLCLLGVRYQRSGCGETPMQRVCASKTPTGRSGRTSSVGMKHTKPRVGQVTMFPYSSMSIYSTDWCRLPIYDTRNR